jgi:hypothetical protein
VHTIGRWSKYFSYKNSTRERSTNLSFEFLDVKRAFELAWCQFSCRVLLCGGDSNRFFVEPEQISAPRQIR